MIKKACFFSNESRGQLQKEQYSIQDIAILNELGFNVTIATSFYEIPLGCDLYFSWWASGSIFPLIKALISNKPIIVIAGGNEAMLYRDSVSREPLGYLATPWYKKLATRLCLRFADKVLVVSNFMVKDVISLGAKSPIVVHNSINTKVFNISKSPRLYVTSIFNLDENVIKIKRGENFIRSITTVLHVFPDQKFIIIGSKNNAYQRLQKLTVELGIEGNVDFIGSIDNSEVVKWLQSSKVYVQISDTETFGVAVAEAMSCGTPVVVSKQGALPEVVGDLGVYVDHNDCESVASGIIDLLEISDKELHDFGFKARNRIVDNYSYENRKAKIQYIVAHMNI